MYLRHVNDSRWGLQQLVGESSQGKNKCNCVMMKIHLNNLSIWWTSMSVVSLQRSWIYKTYICVQRFPLWQKEASDIPSTSELLCFCILPSMLFFHAKFYGSTLVLLRYMLGICQYKINDRHILLFYKEYHFCHLLPFVKLWQPYPDLSVWAVTQKSGWFPGNLKQTACLLSKCPSKINAGLKKSSESDK